MGKAKRQADFLNNNTYLQYRDRILNIALNRFEWKNLPDSVNERFLEEQLIFKGEAVYFDDPVLGNLCLAVADGGTLNVYKEPTKPMAYSINYNKTLELGKNCVIIHNNRTRTPTFPLIKYYARKLSTIDRVIDVNVSAQRTPFFVAVDETAVPTARLILDKIFNNEDVVVAQKNLDVNSIKVFPTLADYRADKLYTLRKQYWSECLNMLGIMSNTSEKKERVITGELEADEQSIIAQRNVFLVERQIAAEEINRMFGTNIEVVFRNMDGEGTGNEIYQLGREFRENSPYSE